MNAEHLPGQTVLCFVLLLPFLYHQAEYCYEFISITTKQYIYQSCMNITVHLLAIKYSNKGRQVVYKLINLNKGRN